MNAAAWASSKTWIVGRIGGLGDLLAHHLLFARQVVGGEGRALNEVGGHRHGQREAALQGADLEAGALVAGGGVDLAALGLDGLDDVAGRAPPAPLNTMCSRRCDQPERRASSQRAPRPATTLSARVSNPGAASQITVTPLARTWRRWLGGARRGHEAGEGAHIGLHRLDVGGQAVETFRPVGEVPNGPGSDR